MKNKKSIIILAVSLILIVIGVVLILTGNNKSFSNKKGSNTDENKDDPAKPMIKVFTKADVMSLIYQFKSPEETWYVGDTALLAHNSDKTKYLARYKRVLSDGSTEEFETIVSNDEDGYHIDLPGWTIDSKNLDEYGFIYYTEGSEDYDPINQQYNPTDVGWDSSNWEYVPDESWKNGNS